MKSRATHVVTTLFLGYLLAGCAPALVATGMATTAVVATQERGARAAFDDAAIHADVETRLLERHETLFNRVGVEVVEQRVLLTGIVPSARHKQEAAKIAKGTPGVSEVLDELTVGNVSRLKIVGNDFWISNRIRALLIKDSKIESVNFHIDTVDGNVFLIGIAQNQAEHQLVTDHARKVRGVKKVVSHILLKDDPRRHKSRK